MTIIIVALICVIIFLLRKNSKEELSKEYIRNRRIKDILMKLYYENFELRYQKEKGKAKNISR